jgi:hypothetical protein
MLVRWLLAAVHLLGLALAWPAASMAQSAAAPSRPPVVTVTGPTVIGFWLVPASDSVLDADPDLASVLDDFQYYWAESAGPLAAAGIARTAQPGQRFRVHEPSRTWLFAAAPDSGAVGYLLVRPGQPPRVLYRVRLPDELLAEARAAFDSTDRQGRPEPRSASP